jgi:hypothetical protein
MVVKLERKRNAGHGARHLQKKRFAKSGQIPLLIQEATMKQCDVYSLIRFSRGFLFGAELVESLEHLEQCPDCRESLQVIARLQATLRASSPVNSPVRIAQ